jgi:hypothetical protein
LAAIKIQSVWCGFWIRSHTELRFSYGEAIFLSAVCKNLRLAHFILKMYRPCGIVCFARKDRKETPEVKGYEGKHEEKYKLQH